jgi:hypothetical protein
MLSRFDEPRGHMQPGHRSSPRFDKDRSPPLPLCSSIFLESIPSRECSLFSCRQFTALQDSYYLGTVAVEAKGYSSVSGPVAQLPPMHHY